MASMQPAARTTPSQPEPSHPTFNVQVSGVAHFPEAATRLAPFANITDAKSFNAFCREACQAWHESHPKGFEGAPSASARFAQLLGQISPSAANTIPTSWGGVVVETYNHPSVRKWLVIKEDGYLALEHHAKKHERIEVKEGVALLLSGPHPDCGQLTLSVMTPGSVATFKPGEVHCVIGCQKVLVWEESIDPDGMDKDLLFIYTPA